MISPDHDVAEYVQVIIIKRKLVFKYVLNLYFSKTMGRNAVQVSMRTGKVIVQITPWAPISLNISS